MGDPTYDMEQSGDAWLASNRDGSTCSLHMSKREAEAEVEGLNMDGEIDEWHLIPICFTRSASTGGERDEPDLRAFAIAIIDASHDWDGCPGDLDGGTLQEIAEKYGVLVVHRVTGPCSEDACVCAEYGGWPADCYRTHPSLLPRTPAAP